MIITGDHGEAFGTPHDVWGHGSNVYEENMHVPLMIWSPRLFKHLGASERRLKQIGGHVDLSPTILDLLDGAASSCWTAERRRGAGKGGACSMPRGRSEHTFSPPMAITC